MRLISFRPVTSPTADPADEPVAGAIVDGDRIVPLAVLADRVLGAAALDQRTAALDLRGLLRADPGLVLTQTALDAARLVLDAAPAALPETRTAPGTVATVPLDRVRLSAPIPEPGKIICVGQNYHGHVREQGLPVPERPMIFAKFANAVVGDREPVIRHEWTRALDLEVELAVIVGRRMRRVAAADAPAHVAGYAAANDISARDLQGSRPALREGEHGDGQWLRAKGSDTFCPWGPSLVTASEIPDPSALGVRSWRIAADGPNAGAPILMQDGSTADMIFDVPRLLEFVSAVITLEPGDVVLTGTPSGVGVFRDPPVFLEPGDVVAVEVAGIGRLANPIVDAAGGAPTGSPAARLLAGEPISIG